MTYLWASWAVAPQAYGKGKSWCRFGEPGGRQAAVGSGQWAVCCGTGLTPSAIAPVGGTVQEREPKCWVKVGKQQIVSSSNCFEEVWEVLDITCEGLKECNP